MPSRAARVDPESRGKKRRNLFKEAAQIQVFA